NMFGMKSLILSAVTIAGLVGTASAAEKRFETVLVTPGHYETRMERHEEPGRWIEEPKVVETSGHYETRSQTVEVPGHYEKVERQIRIEGHFGEKRYAGPAI